MRTALTLVELIFIIVILGILGSISIPKLTATRDDAVIVSCVTDIKRFIQDMTYHSITTGEISFWQANKFTNVDINTTGANGLKMSVGISASGNVQSRIATYSYYCGRKRDKNDLPSLLISIINSTSDAKYFISINGNFLASGEIKKGASKLVLLELNTSYNIDKLLHKRLKEIGLEGKDIDIGTGKRVVY